MSNLGERLWIAIKNIVLWISIFKYKDFAQKNYMVIQQDHFLCVPKFYYPKKYFYGQNKDI